eukprot:764310-Hanusia_phi.AAC.4
MAMATCRKVDDSIHQTGCLSQARHCIAGRSAELVRWSRVQVLWRADPMLEQKNRRNRENQERGCNLFVFLLFLVLVLVLVFVIVYMFLHQARKYKLSMESVEVELNNSRSEEREQVESELLSEKTSEKRLFGSRLEMCCCSLCVGLSIIGDEIINVRKREAAELQESEEKFKSEVERRDRSLRFMQGRLDALECENEQLQSEIVNYRKQLKGLEQENRSSSARDGNEDDGDELDGNGSGTDEEYDSEKEEKEEEERRRRRRRSSSSSRICM